MISVCMATYNGEKHLREQVDSILLQLGEKDELVISDDGSTDNTLSILETYKDARIRIFHHVKTSQKFYYAYPSANFENALRHAKGDIIFLSDQDDVWLEGKVNKMVEKLKCCDVVLSDCSFVDSNLGMLVPSKIEFEKVRIGTLRNLYKCGYLGSAMAFKSHILNYVLPLPKNVPHDIWIGLVGNFVGRFEILPEVTMLYRRHDKNVSGTNNKLLDKQKNRNAVKLSENRNSLSFRINYRMTIIKSYLIFVLKQFFSTSIAAEKR